MNFLTASNSLDDIPVCDAAFLFGSTKSDQIAKSGADYFKKGLVKKVICTGKYSLSRDSGPYGFSTEAEWFADILIKEGVPKNAIILDTESTNTLENVRYGISACHKQGFYPKSLILIPIPPLCRRACATFEKQFPEIKIFIYVSDLIIENYLKPDRMKRVLGEFDRFKEYAARGDMIDVHVPQNVLEALNFLKTASTCKEIGDSV